MIKKLLLILSGGLLGGCVESAVVPMQELYRMPADSNAQKFPIERDAMEFEKGLEREGYLDEQDGQEEGGSFIEKQDTAENKPHAAADTPEPAEAVPPSSVPSTEQATDSQPAAAPVVEGPNSDEVMASIEAGATQPAEETRYILIDPNETRKLVYGANYEHIWQESLKLLNDMGFRLDRQDYRHGIITTLPKDGVQIIEPWRKDLGQFRTAMENTINFQRRTIRIAIRKQASPRYYEIAIQVCVERRSNPQENLGTSRLFGSTAFGKGVDRFNSDYFTPEPGNESEWYLLGREPGYEKQMLAELFKSI